MEKRKCQIHAVFPITCFTVPIIGHTELNLTTEEIYKCLCAKAEVSEILPSGKMVRLDFTNYNKPSVVKTEVKKETKPVVEQKPVEEKVLIVEDKVEVKEEIVEDKTEATIEEEKQEIVQPVKTHEVSSRNNNYRQNNHKNRKNNNRQNKR